MAFKMKSPTLLKMVSALKRKIKPMIPTAGPTDGVTARDVETEYEEAFRGLAPRGSVSDVLKRRQDRYKRGYDEYGKKIKPGSKITKNKKG
jgi:hypothetical protein